MLNTPHYASTPQCTVWAPTSTQALLAEWAELTRTHPAFTLVAAPNQAADAPNHQRTCFHWDASPLQQITTLEPANMVGSVQTGLPLGQLQAALQQQGLALPLTLPPHTPLGHLLAANTPPLEAGSTPRSSWPSRVLGLQAITVGSPQGAQLTQCGGQVLKNVSGYDLQRFYLGQQQRLVLLSEATLRLEMAPTTAPPTTLCLPLEALTPLQQPTFWQGLAHGQPHLQVLELMNAATLHHQLQMACPTPWALVLQWHPTAEESEQQSQHALQQWLQRVGLKAEEALPVESPLWPLTAFEEPHLHLQWALPWGQAGFEAWLNTVAALAGTPTGQQPPERLQYRLLAGLGFTGWSEAQAPSVGEALLATAAHTLMPHLVPTPKVLSVPQALWALPQQLQAAQTHPTTKALQQAWEALRAKFDPHHHLYSRYI